MTINIPDSSLPRVVIIGAGFGGLLLAKKLAKSGGFQVVLLDKNNYHQFQPLFYQVAMAGLEPSSIVFPLRKMFRNYPDVYIRVTEVKEVTCGTNEVHTDLGSLHYDYLVIATGVDTNYFGNMEVAAHAIPMKSVSEALYLRNRILNDYEQAITTGDYETRQGLVDIVIVGGGPTGVEVAGALAEMRQFILPKDYRELNVKEVDILLIQSSPQLLKGMSEQASEAALRYLEELGVNVLLNNRVTGFDGKWVDTKDGTRIRANKVIWAAGITGNLPKGMPETAVGPGMRLKVNRFGEVDACSDIYAIGDIAYMETPAYPEGHPQVAQVAIQQARNLAHNILQKQKGKSLRPFEYRDKGSMATIGRHRAVVDLPKTHLHGAFAWLIWLLVHLFSLIGAKNKLFVFLNWVWNYFTYDQSLRLIIRPRVVRDE